MFTDVKGCSWIIMDVFMDVNDVNVIDVGQ